MRPGVCAAICTRDRAELLERALESLRGQTSPPDEILVVDNAPTDERTRLLVAGKFPDIRYVREPTPGLNFARNRALRATAREIVAYMDDDAVADPGWIERTLGVLTDHPRVAVCTGRVRPLVLETEAQRLFEAQGGFDRGEATIHMPQDAETRRMHGLRAPLIAWSLAVGVGAAMAVRRSLIESIGGFDTALDLGAALPGGGDVDIIWRVLDSGLEVVYEPAAIVMHEHRRDLDGVHAQILGHRRAEIAFLTKSLRAARGRQRPVIAAFLLWRLTKPGVRLVKRACSMGEPLPSPLLRRLWLDSWRGLRAYDSALELAQERSARAGG